MPFPAHLQSKLEKSTITLKRFFLKKSKKVSKNAEFHADFKSVEKFVKKCKQKKLWAKQVWRTWVKVKIVHFYVTFLLINFFWYIFSKLFQRIRNQREILRFLTPFSIKKKKKKSGHINPFFEFLTANAQETAQKNGKSIFMNLS